MNSDETKDVDLTGICVFDGVPADGILRVRTAGSVVLFGWATGEPEKPLPTKLHLELRSARTGVVDCIEVTRVARPDVATHFGKPEFTMAGFTATVALRFCMNGSYFVSVVQQGPGDELYRAVDTVRLEPEVQAYELAARDGLAAKFLSGSGLEIGALQRRLNLPPGCDARYVDRMPFEMLLEHYPELRGLPIQPPDIIDDGETLSTIDDESQDFVAANHFLEHCQDPVGAIVNLLRVIRTGGFLYMAVPDRNYTFDSERPPTRYEMLSATHIAGVRPDRERLFAEWARYVHRLEGDALELETARLLAENYSIHYNVWSLPELLDFLSRARIDFQLPFRISGVVSSENEVIAVLQRTSAGVQ